MSGKTHPIRLAVSALVGLGLLFAALAPLAAGAITGQAQDDGTRTSVHPATGMLNFIGAAPSSPIAMPHADIDDQPPEARAGTILDVYGPSFGVQNPQEELFALRTKSIGGREIVRYQQVYQGVPVLGGELIVNMTREGDLLSMSGEISPALSISTTPGITAEEARASALQYIAKVHNLDVAQLSVTAPALWIFDQRLIQPLATQPAHLVWRMEVTAGPRPIRELVLVNAARGSVSLHVNQVDTAWAVRPGQTSRTSGIAAPPASNRPIPSAALGTPDLWTYNSNGTGAQRWIWVCNNSVRNCGSANSDANNAHAYAYDTYSAYAAAPYNRDSIDGAGMTIISNVNWNNGTDCPNAFWDGDEMTYCTGLAADDVVAHELTHGVTQYESSLFYWYQAGAINESFSDVWGEYVDQTNGYGNDAAAVKWLIGEDTTGLGVIRSMKTPGTYGDPDSITSTRYYEGEGDNGGVHINSGVNNKAVYLMVDGGTFNYKTVTALGWAKTIAIYYEANTNLLVSGSDYLDLYNALYQACLNKIDTNGIVLADCQEVRDATDAVKMNLQPATNFNPDAAYCPTGYSRYTDIYKDDFETGSDGWTFGAAVGDSPEFSLWSVSVWYPYFGPYATSGVESLYGDDYTTTNDSWAASPAILLPAGKPYLHFTHSYGLDHYGTTYYDGGVVEYTTNGGATWTDASALFSGGQNYTGTLSSSWGNPLGGRRAFSSVSHGFVDSRYDLTSLAGQTVQFRWRLGTDSAAAYYGWWVDDVDVYTCLGIPSMPTLQSPASNALVTDYTPTLDWSDSTGALDHYQIQVDDNSDFSSPIIDENPVAPSEYTPALNLPDNTKLYWRVRSKNVAGGASTWTASRYFRTALLPPYSNSPGNEVPGAADNVYSRRPTFNWDPVPGAAAYTLEVSTAATFATKAINKSVATTTYAHTADLAANTVYYWRVRATGTNGPSLYSQVRTFSTGNPPSIPTLASPANNALVTTTTPLLNWNNSTVPGGTTFGAYEIQIDTSNTFGAPIIAYRFDVSDSDYTTPALLNGTTYYWRVRSWNTGLDGTGGTADDEYSGWSAVRSIRIAYAAPTLLLPADLSTGLALKPTFTWNAVAGATSYGLQVSKVNTFATLAISKTVYAATYTHTTNLTPNTVYYWRVKVNGPYGPSPWSVTFQFTTTP